MGQLKDTNVVVHSNYFAVAIDKKMTAIEQRMFAIYLSKLNPHDKGTRTVTFGLEEYERIMGLQRYNITQLKDCARKILNTPVILDQPDGGFLALNLFTSFELKKVKEKWVVAVDCSNRMLPYLFDLKQEFMKYELWNMLNLSEKNHQQLYRLLKQYEKIGSKIFPFEELKMRLGVEESVTYRTYPYFRRDVLEKCKNALAKNTDLCFTFESIRKGRSVHSIKFLISPNKNRLKSPLPSDFLGSAEVADGSDSCRLDDKPQPAHSSLHAFELTNGSIPETNNNQEILLEKPPTKPREELPIEDPLAFFSSACDDEFTSRELRVLLDLVGQVLPGDTPSADLDFKRYHYLKQKYHEMDMRHPDKSRLGYLRTIIRFDLEASRS